VLSREIDFVIKIANNFLAYPHCIE